jgi:hypothetical protein
MLAIIISAVILVVAAVAVTLLVLKKKKSKSPPVTDTVNIYRSILGNPAGASASPAAPSPPTDDPDLVARLRQDLRLKFLYQEDKVDIAIQNERDRNPTASLTDLMQAAIKRYERENH